MVLRAREDSLTRVSLKPSKDLAPFISYNDLTMTVFFQGSKSSEFLAGIITTIKITLIGPSVKQGNYYTQVVLFKEASESEDSVD